MRDGKRWTTLQAKSVFLGLNADFTWSKDRLSVDSNWQVTEPASHKPLDTDKPTTDPILPSDLPDAQFHVLTYKDKGWDMAPGKQHAFWAGTTFGILRNGFAMSMDDMIKKRKPSRLAVFLTAFPLAR